MSFAAHFYTAALGGKRQEREPGGDECRGWGVPPGALSSGWALGAAPASPPSPPVSRGRAQCYVNPQPGRPRCFAAVPSPAVQQAWRSNIPSPSARPGAVSTSLCRLPPADPHRFCPRAQPLPAPSAPHPSLARFPPLGSCRGPGGRGITWRETWRVSHCAPSLQKKNCSGCVCECVREGGSCPRHLPAFLNIDLLRRFSNAVIKTTFRECA